VRNKGCRALAVPHRYLAVRFGSVGSV